MATGAPGTNGVWQYGEDDSEATFSALLNKAASTTDTQLGLDRARLDTLEANPIAGLIPVTSGTATNSGGSVTVNASGLFTVTGVSNIAFDGVFTSATKKYKIILSNIAYGSATGTDVNLRLRASGTDSTTSYYVGGFASSGASSVVDNLTNGSGFYAGIHGTTSALASSNIEIYNPASTTYTNYLAHAYGWTGSNRIKVLGGFHDSSSVYDGFKIYPSAGVTMSFSLQIFKYKE